MSDVSVIGIDLAKRVFHVVGMNCSGRVVFRRRFCRVSLLEFLGKHPRVLIGLEACGGSHYWGRALRKYGHEVRLMSPQFVKSYVKSNKNDTRDAEAIAEAVTRPTMRYVSVKSVEQQELQFLHRVRERLIKGRTALVNELRGILGEYGIVAPQGAKRLMAKLPELLKQTELLSIKGILRFPRYRHSGSPSVQLNYETHN